MRYPPGRILEARDPRATPGARPAACGVRIPAVRALFVLVCLLPAACSLDGEDTGDTFDLEADPALVAYGRLVVSVEDTSGLPLGTLFDDSLTSPDRLRRLPARNYRGGLAHIVLRAYRAGILRYRETRLYDGDAQKVLAVTIDLDPVPGALGPAPSLAQAPTVTALPGDTTVSIRDSVPFRIEAFDADGDLSGYALDCDGDGRFEDSGSFAGSRDARTRGRRYPDTGSFACLLEVRDNGGRTARAHLRVRVELDPPVAEAGPDITAQAGSLVHLVAWGRDGFGPIASREWKIGEKPFQAIPAVDFSFEAPETPGTVPCILRVTDTDRLTDLDTVLVHVIPRTSRP